jgi:hypothetical protein
LNGGSKLIGSLLTRDAVVSSSLLAGTVTATAQLRAPGVALAGPTATSESSPRDFSMQMSTTIGPRLAEAPQPAVQVPSALQLSHIQNELTSLAVTSPSNRVLNR